MNVLTRQLISHLIIIQLVKNDPGELVCNMNYTHTHTYTYVCMCVCVYVKERLIILLLLLNLLLKTQSFR